MSVALRNVVLAAIAGVVLAHALLGRSWTMGLAVITLSVVSALPLRSSRFVNLVVRSAPYTASVAGAALVVQLIGVTLDQQYGRSAGYLPHANTAAAATLALWVLLIECTTVAKGDAQGRALIVVRLMMVAGTAIATLLLLASGNRSLILGLLVGFVVVQLVYGGRRSIERIRFVILSLPVVVLALVVVLHLRSDITYVFGTFERVPIFLTALSIAQLSPWVGLGNGAWGTWAGVVDPTLPTSAAAHSHSLILTVLVEGGAIGLASLLLLLVVIAGSVKNRFSVHEPSGGTLLVTFVALGIQALIDQAILHPVVYVPLFLTMITRIASGELSTSRRAEAAL